ncbi:MAG: penicillin-binding protein activator [Gammaproteobacteria bacterium]|jgi:hypothetical protein
MNIPRPGISHLLCHFITMALLVACNVAAPPAPIPQIVEQREPRSIDEFLQLAESSREPLASEYRITAAELLLQDQQPARAAQVVAAISQENVRDNRLRIRLSILQADLALASDEPEAALNWLDEDLLRALTQRPALQQQVNQRRAEALLAARRYAESVLILSESGGYGLPADRQKSHDLLWQGLQRVSEQELTQLAEQADSYQLRGWIELARAMHSEEYSIPAQQAALERWQSVWNRHSAASMPPTALQRLAAVWDRRPKHLALLLPVQEPIGRAVQDGFLSAYYEAMESDGNVPQITVFDTSGVAEIRELYQRAVDSGADLIIGPLNKELVRQLNNLPSLPVPTLALNYTDLESRNSEFFYQFGLALEDEIRQAANRAWQAGFRNAAVIAPDDADYSRLQQAFTRTWESLGGSVVSAVNYSSEGDYADTVKGLLAIDDSEARAARIRALLPREEIEFIPVRRGDIDFIFLMANARQGRQIKPTLAFYFAEDVPVYAVPSINDGSGNELVNRDLNGIIFTDIPWLLEQWPLRATIAQSLRPAQGALQRLRALGVDSFRLYARLDQLAQGELINFRGATGLLSMKETGAIERIPQTAVFIDGRTVRLEDTGSLVTN